MLVESNSLQAIKHSVVNTLLSTAVVKPCLLRGEPCIVSIMNICNPGASWSVWRGSPRASCFELKCSILNTLVSSKSLRRKSPACTKEWFSTITYTSQSSTEDFFSPTQEISGCRFISFRSDALEAYIAMWPYLKCSHQMHSLSFILLACWSAFDCGGKKQP